MEDVIENRVVVAIYYRGYGISIELSVSCWTGNQNVVVDEKEVCCLE